jgi:Rrf2 family cysteine metabolism transcriptional repressor
VKISLKTEYACRVLAQLGKFFERQELSHIEALAEAEDIPANYLVQILNDLRNAGLITSRRGKQGGYLLAKAPAEISLLQILQAIDGEVLEMSAKPAGQSGKKVAAVWKDITGLLSERTAAISLEDMMPEETREMYYI